MYENDCAIESSYTGKRHRGAQKMYLFIFNLAMLVWTDKWIKGKR